MKSGYGEDTRYSKTLSKKTIYCAVRLADGSVLRVSQDQLTVLTLILNMIQPLLLVVAFGRSPVFCAGTQEQRKKNCGASESY